VLDDLLDAREVRLRQLAEAQRLAPRVELGVARDARGGGAGCSSAAKGEASEAGTSMLWSMAAGRSRAIWRARSVTSKGM